MELSFLILLFANFAWCLCLYGLFSNVSKTDTVVWGPGLKADFRVPVRYFFIQTVLKDGRLANESIGEKAFTVSLQPEGGERARIWAQVLDRHDGSYIVRYRLFSSAKNLVIKVLLAGEHVSQSPYLLEGTSYHENCNCPHGTSDDWADSVGCPASFGQIGLDLSPFQRIDMGKVAQEAVERFNARGYHSICHYKVKDNTVYRKCYGEHVGFKMFSDAILLSLTRKMVLPDFEFIMNLGDWPLERVSTKDPLPILSWCGSEDSYDIVLPTYDLTEATLEMMGRISLDIFSTQANTGPKWENKTSRAFWRGRDSRKERLQLVELSRKYPSLMDAALTNMFFFPKDEEKYGAVQKHVSFFDFFKWKYQLNIDGTVAAFRLPYLLAGDAVVFKQDSSYYEHFYRDLQPYVHYIPIQHDLSDVLEKIKWAKDNDEEVRQIARNGQEYARANLTPVDVLCYHTRLFQEYSKLLTRSPISVEGFELVEQPNEACECQPQQAASSKSNHEEL